MNEVIIMEANTEQRKRKKLFSSYKVFQINFKKLNNLIPIVTQDFYFSLYFKKTFSEYRDQNFKYFFTKFFYYQS